MAAKYHCNYCDEDIKDLRVKCRECPDFDLCLKCFSCGAEIGCHRKKHAYQLIDCGTFPIFGPPADWRATEELALLDAVELYGFGNWGDIADYVNSHSASEVEEHFLNYYVHGVIGKLTWNLVKASNSDSSVPQSPDGRPLSPSLTASPPPPPNLSVQEQQYLGYMPMREDFEREYDNEAESLVSMLTLSSNDDDELDLDLKLAQVDMYKKRLYERLRKKNVAREYNLVEAFYKALSKEETQLPLQHCDKSDSAALNTSKSVDKTKKKLSSNFAKLSRDDSESSEMALKNYSQFHSAVDHKRLQECLRKEKDLKLRIKELARCRRNGVTKSCDSVAFESARNKRDKKKENKKKTLGSAEENIGSGRKSPKKSIGMENQGSSQISSTNAKSVRNSNPGRIGSKDSNALSLGHIARRDAREEPQTDTDEAPVGRSSGKGSLKRGKFDVFLMPSSQLLSENEKKLCSSLRLRPSQYITLKALILKECGQKSQKGVVPKSNLENIDKFIRRKVMNFMSKAGWIRAS